MTKLTTSDPSGVCCTASCHLHLELPRLSGWTLGSPWHEFVSSFGGNSFRVWTHTALNLTLKPARLHVLMLGCGDLGIPSAPELHRPGRFRRNPASSSKSLQIIATGEVWRKPSHTDGGNVNWLSHGGERLQRFLKKLQVELPCDPAVPLLGIYLEKMKTLI